MTGPMPSGQTGRRGICMYVCNVWKINHLIFLLHTFQFVSIINNTHLNANL
jgi:hypothetical protein